MKDSWYAAQAKKEMQREQKGRGKFQEMNEGSEEMPIIKLAVEDHLKLMKTRLKLDH